jgi:predicted GH43/DUF377 family glycosyl hydrolase
MSIEIKRLDAILKADIKRVLLRPFNPTTEERSQKIIKRVLSLSANQVELDYDQILNDFKHRHRDVELFFMKRYQDNTDFVDKIKRLSEKQKLLIGAYFTLEYSLEAASLFNPSMVWHPDQTSLPRGSQRFIISLRATGEGHISSIEFRSGVVNPDHTVAIDKSASWVTNPSCKPEKNGYQAVFSKDYPLSERVLFPYLPEEINGVEDLRLVCFISENKKKTYYGTYTAYDGRKIYTMLLETSDFLTFSIRKLLGNQIQNKGLALFPRKIKSDYVMLSRQDNENNYIMFSDRLDRWDKKSLLMEPRYPWEFFQIGNCGSPLETDEGWLVLAHGVDPMRKYVISAFLLDLNDPTRIIGRLKKNLLMANEKEREGYVPNVVYTCGGQIYNNSLVFPYAMSDYACGFAQVSLDSLLNELC